MTWVRRELAAKGKAPLSGVCPSCAADLIPKMRPGQKECFYYCSRKRCVFEKNPVPPSSKPYTGPGKRA